MKHPYVRPTLVTLLATVLVTALLAAALPASADEPQVISREYASPVLSRHTLEALLWEACTAAPPPAADQPSCAVYDSREEGYAVRLVAPPSIQQAAVAAVLESERSGSRSLRLDLLAVQPGAADDLGTLPAAAATVLAPLRAANPGAGLVRLDTAQLLTRNEASAYLVSGERAFRIDLDLHGHGDTAPLAVALRYPAPHEKDALTGTLLTTTLDLPPHQTRLVGTTRYAPTSPQLILLLTADP